MHQAANKDDPHRRRPDISLAKRTLGWSPRVSVDDVSATMGVRVLFSLTALLTGAAALPQGLARTIEYFKEELDENRQEPRTVLWN